MRQFDRLAKNLCLRGRNLALVPLILFGAFTAHGQGNTVSGHVYGPGRTPVSDATVELLDEFSRLVARARTDNSGRYFFNGAPSGRVVVRVSAFDTDYEEQEQSLEIVNFSRETASGQRRISGFSNEQLDFYLKPRKGALLVTDTVFIQEVPADARALYDRAIIALNGKKEEQGLKDLKTAIETFPKYYDAIVRLGAEYARLQHYEAAQVLFAVAVEINPRGRRAWYGLAYSLNSMERFDDAFVAAKKGVDLGDASPESLLLYGVLLRKQKQYNEAAKQMLRAIQLAKGVLPSAHWQLALLYAYDLERYRDAAKQLRLFLKAQPNTKDAENIKKLIAEFEAKQ